MSDEVDKDKRQFLLAATTAVGAAGCVAAASPFISSWLPSAKAIAEGGPIDVNLEGMLPGQQKTVEWRGKPVWIIKRNKEMLKSLEKPNNNLRDPESKVNQQPDYAKNHYRSRHPEYLVLVGICTHLGCSPKYKPQFGELGADWPGGFLCPCHGSTFDLAGRVFKGVPAPINLEVPPYYFKDEHNLVIGLDAP